MKTKKLLFPGISLISNSTAFTVVEVIITMLLIAVIIAISMPRLADSLAQYQTVTTIRRLVSDIQYTQQLATKSEDTMASYEIVFNPQLEQYSIRHGSKIIRIEKFPTWVHLAGTNFSQYSNQQEILTFSIQGNPVKAGTITITNKRTGKVNFVRIAVLTGRVRVETS